MLDDDDDGDGENAERLSQRWDGNGRVQYTLFSFPHRRYGRV